MLILYQNNLLGITLDAGRMPKMCCLATGNNFSWLRAEIIVENKYLNASFLAYNKCFASCMDLMGFGHKADNMRFVYYNNNS